MGRGFRADGDFAGGGDLGGVAFAQLVAVHHALALDLDEVGLAGRVEVVVQHLVGAEHAHEHLHVLMDADGRETFIARGDGHPLPHAILPVEAVVAVGGLDVGRVGQNPDLQEAQRLARVVELAVHDAAAGAHVLHVAAPEAAAVAQAVAVRELAVHDVADDFHIVVRMRVEPAVRVEAVVVHDAQCAELDVLRVVVLGEREMELAVQPSAVASAHVLVLDDLDHGAGSF